MKISVKLIESENEIIANCPELDINCYGANKDQAVKRIKSVIDFYVNSAKELGLDVDNLNEIVIDGQKNNLSITDSVYDLKDTIN